MVPVYYLLLPLVLLAVGFIWKLRRASRGGAVNPEPAPAPPPPGSLVGESVEELVARGQIIAAIKLYMDLNGTGLKAAKDAVEAYQQGQPLPGRTTPLAPAPARSPVAADADPEVRRLVANDQLIEAIKRYRDLSGVGLKEAKDAVERLAGR